MPRDSSELAGRAAQMARRTRASGVMAALAIWAMLLGTPPSQATDLKQPTLDAWDAYVQVVNTTTQNRAAGSSPYLWVDQTPDLVQRIRNGELVVTNHDPREVPHGLIHHWLGAMFLPGVTLDQVLGVLDNYDQYSEYYKPLVGKSAVVDRSGDSFKIAIVTVQKAFGVTAAVETDNDVQIVRLDANRIYLVSSAYRVAEIADYGQPSEHPYTENDRPGYVWRTIGVTRLDQRDGGVYVEMETIALSRGIPVAFRWLIKPLTDSLPRKIMFETLDDTREAVSRQLSPGPRVPVAMGITGAAQRASDARAANPGQPASASLASVK
jgi:hypothetical protein